MGYIEDRINNRDARQYEPEQQIAGLFPKLGPSDEPPKPEPYKPPRLQYGDEPLPKPPIKPEGVHSDVPEAVPIDPKTGRPIITVGLKPQPFRPAPSVKDAAATGHSYIENQFAKKEADKDIDYSTGAPFATRVLLQRASNPDEAKAVLSKSWGEGNYGQDFHGNWWVKHDGKRVAVLPNTITGSFENFAAGMAGSSAATGGAIAGAAAGEMVFPLGGGIPGAMVGAALGRGIDDLTKWAQGTFAQKPADVVSSLAEEATLAGGFQAAGPLGRRSWEGVKSFIQKTIADTTPATRAMARDIAGPTFGKGGKPSPFLNYRRWQNRNIPKGEAAQPPIGSYAPGMTKAEYHRELRNMLRGMDPQEANRIAYLNQRMRQILSNEGIPRADVDRMMEEIHKKTYEISTTEAGELVTGKAHQIDVELRREAQAQTKQVDDAVADANAKIFGIGATPSPQTAQDVADRLVAERIRTSKMLSKVYQTIDRLNGDKPLVSTKLIRQIAKSARWKLPKSAISPIIKEFASKDALRDITFEQAHALRTTFREMANIIDVTPLGTRKGYFARMAGAVDKAMRDVPPDTSKGVMQMLDQADKAYSEHIRRFESTEVNQIIRSAKKGYMPTAGSVAKLIMKPDKPNLAKMIFSMLDEKTRANVIKADMRNIINETSYIDSRGVTKVDGKVLMETLRQRNSLMNRTYPGNILRSLREYARYVAARDGKIDVDAFKSPEGIMAALQKANGALRAAEEFAKNNPLRALMSANPMQVDAALREIAKPGEEAVTESVAKQLGVDSDEWRAVRRATLHRLFGDSIVETSSLQTTVAGKSIEDALAKYTKRQQELLFPHGLADDLRLLSKEAKFLFPQQGPLFQMGGAGRLAAGSILSKSWLNVAADIKYANTAFWGYVADHPRIIRFLTDEIKRDPKYARSMMSVLGQWITDTVIEGGPGQGKPGRDLDPKGHVAPQPEPISFGGPHA